MGTPALAMSQNLTINPNPNTCQKNIGRKERRKRFMEEAKRKKEVCANDNSTPSTRHC